MPSLGGRCRAAQQLSAQRFSMMNQIALLEVNSGTPQFFERCLNLDELGDGVQPQAAATSRKQQMALV
jgi:hypothetical protein